MDKRKVDAIYTELLDLTASERAGRLDALCGDDADLKAEVGSLLAASERDTGFQDRFEEIRNDYWRAITGEDQQTDEDLSGERFGIWQLDARIGRGGIATVYRADRADGEFSQRAAFKVLRRGLDTDDLIARFRAEREILASLEHPGIAHILDGGTLPDGRPYLVLEYVDGTHIIDYAQAQRLNTRQRLMLLKQVAEALHHAHQHLVVHRDVKPSNVMVTDEGIVRLLDFGIAKILDPSTSPIAARLTRTGVAMLTPAYGSPELFSGEAVTTGSDIYQLGLLMAELLTGRPPLSSHNDVPRPDLTGLREKDLIAIIHKATREEASGRYDSAGAMGADLNCFLASRPVQARPDSWMYRASRFMKRKPLVAPTAILLLAAVLIYILTITSYSRQLARERTIAEQTQAFMVRLFESPDPRAPADPERGRSITVVEALDIGRDKVLNELNGQPELQASLSRTISAVYAALDQYRPAIELREQALALEEDVYGKDSHAALASMRALARLYLNTGNLDTADRYNERQLALARALEEPGVELGFAEHAAAQQALQLGQEDEAAGLLESAIAGLLESQNLSGTVDVDALLALTEGASRTGATMKGIETAERMALETLGPRSPAGLVMRTRVAAALTQIGEYEAAEQRYLETLPIMEVELGRNHPDTLSTRNNLGYLYSSWGRYAEAEAIHRDLLATNLASAPDSQNVAYNYQNLATAVANQGRAEEALALHALAFEQFSRVFDEHHYLTALPLLSMAYLQLELEAPEAAESSARKALDRLEAAQPGTYLVGIARCLEGMAQYRQGDPKGLAAVADARTLMNHIKVPEKYARLCGLQ